MTEINVRHEFENVWSYLHCPDCSTPIRHGEDTPFTRKWGKQTRCSNCKVLFDWEDDE